MYTQCPDCSTAFRVTAEVLKQAAGKVRCGGCGVAFNALDHLSEQRPASAAAAAGQGSGARRISKAPQLQAAEAPKTITPERSAALLKTLDELAGSDNVRIEDTGVEWRVLDESEVDETAGEDSSTDSGPVRTIEDTGSMRFVIADNDSGASGEMRFDDNTPLPDDFDFDEEPAKPPPPPEPVEEPPDHDLAQADLALGDPEEWQDLLGEVQGPPEGVGERRDPSAESDSRRALAEELAGMRADDDDSPSSIDEQFAMQAEAMGIDISGAYKKAIAEQPEPEARDIDDTSIDDDLIAAAFETEEQQRRDREATLAEPIDEAIDSEDEEEESEEIVLEAGPEDLDSRDSLDLELDASSAEIEALDIELDDSGMHEALDMELDDSGSHEALDIELDDSGSHEALDMELVEEDIEAMEAVLDARADKEVDDVKPEPPPLSEEELTINKMIDEDLLAIAVEDDDGFASTIVQIQPIEEIKPLEAADEPDDEAEDEVDVFTDNPLVETIVMEGDAVRDEAAQRALEKRRRKQAKEREIEEARRKEAKAAEEKVQAEAAEKAAKRARTFRMVAGIVALALLLALQVLHFSRDTLATNPVIQNLIAPIYRVFGQDILPAYDVRGWRFEVTRGSVSDGDNTLTIFSRIGNESDMAMPYPRISVSLTDRYEDTIGGTVVDSTQYLGENADTLAQVAPHGTFDAMITIEAADAEAVGFKLNVCYDYPGKRLRCAMEDFR